LLLADAPRQTINALTLYAIYLSKRDTKRGWWDIGQYFVGNTVVTSALTVSTAFTVIICAGSILLLFAAGVLYIPLLCHIKGNLKVGAIVLGGVRKLTSSSRNTAAIRLTRYAYTVIEVAIHAYLT
jgi:hypothetical protein